MRDTDKDWAAIGDAHPYYGVLTHERYLNPSADDLSEFFLSGERDIAHLRTAIAQHFGAFEPTAALDFGCGVGRLAIPLARLTGRAAGVDISEGMLARARVHAAEAGVEIDFMHQIPDAGEFDWVNTSIVLQHIPPARGYGIIRKLWAAVAAGGVLTLHLTIYKDARHIAELQRDLSAFRYDGEMLVNYAIEDDENVGMSMYDYDLSRVFQILDLQDGQAVYMEKTDHGGCHGFRIYVKKR
jgi:SAM-dependent methyltransferase